MKRALPPIFIAADMAYHGLVCPSAGRWLGSRVEGRERILVWQLEDGTLLEQRMPRGLKRPLPDGISVEVELKPQRRPPLRLVTPEKK